MSKPYTYDDLVRDLHMAINRCRNPRAVYNFLMSLRSAPPTHPQTGREKART